MRLLNKPIITTNTQSFDDALHQGLNGSENGNNLEIPCETFCITAQTTVNIAVFCFLATWSNISVEEKMSEIACF